MNKKILTNVFVVVAIIFGLMFLKSNTVYAGVWMKTSDKLDTGVNGTTGAPIDTTGYKMSSFPANATDTVQAWHYTNYWKITDMNVANSETVYDSNVGALLGDYTTGYLTCYVNLSSAVLANIALNGEDSIRAMVSFAHPETLADSKILWYRVNGSRLEIQFKGHLVSTGNFWAGRSGFVAMPKPDSSYGENALSVFDINSSTPYGAIYTVNYGIPYHAYDVTMTSSGWGTLSAGNYEVQAPGGGWSKRDGKTMRVSLGALRDGGAQAAVYYFPLSVQLFTKDAKVIPPLPSGVEVKYIDQSTGEDIIARDTNETETVGEHTYNAKSISGYILQGSSSQTITVVAGKSYTVTFNYKATVVPTITLSVPSQVVVGDDFGAYSSASSEDPTVTSMQDTITINGANNSPIVGPTTPGNSTNTSGMAWFSSVGNYTATAYARDSNGSVANADPKDINVIEPFPIINIIQSGALKENRKIIIDANASYGGSQRFPIDWSSAKWVITPLNGALMSDLRIQNHTTGSSNGAILYDPSKSINQSLNGLSIFDVTSKKLGQYKFELTCKNTYGNYGTNSYTANIVVDAAPTSGFSVPSILLRDPSNPDTNGNAQATASVTDTQSGSSGCYSTDADMIDKIAWLYSFDANNNGTYVDDNWFVYNSSTQKWQLAGSMTDAKNLNLETVPVGLLHSISLSTAHVGKYDIEAICREVFGQEYIPQFTSISDRKIGSSFGK